MIPILNVLREILIHFCLKKKLLTTFSLRFLIRSLDFYLNHFIHTAYILNLKQFSKNNKNNVRIVSFDDSANPDPMLKKLMTIWKIVADIIPFSISAIALVFFNIWVRFY